MTYYLELDGKRLGQRTFKTYVEASIALAAIVEQVLIAYRLRFNNTDAVSEFELQRRLTAKIKIVQLQSSKNRNSIRDIPNATERKHPRLSRIHRKYVNV